MYKKNKIKYFPFKPNKMRNIAKWRLEIVDNPTLYKTLPDGKYLIRGDIKGKNIEYWVINNVWYVFDTDIDSCVISYNIVPNLSKKEWEDLGKHYNKLSNRWKEFVRAYELSVWCNEITRRTKLVRYKTIKK